MSKVFLVTGSSRGLGREIVLADWRRRPVWEKLIGTVAWILERQQ